jgi:hypothetical protein
VAHLSSVAQGLDGVRVGEEEGTVYGSAQGVIEGSMLESHVQGLDGVLGDVWCSVASGS